MSNKNYVALHNHSHYSTLDGFATVDEYIRAAKENGMEGIGLTDHGTASGLYKFITRTQEAGLTPVPGVEFYVAPENPLGAKVQGPIYYGRGGQKAPKYDVSNGAYTHLTVFAYNNVGIENLFKLTSLSWQQENFYFKPRIDTAMLAEYSEGLIVTTGCPSSEVNRRFLLGQDDKAYEYASRLKSIFGENMYVEIMDHGMKEEELERTLMPKLIKLARELDLPLIATNDSHYAFKQDSDPHEHVLAVSTKSNMAELPFYKGGTRFAFSTPDYYIKSYDEMLEIYPEDVAEEALANTVELMNKCKSIKLEYDPHLRPEIDIPEGHTAVSYLQELILAGFLAKRGHETEEIKEESMKRIREEFQVLHSNDFISYFLVVNDYIAYAHSRNIGVGAGRGSVGGSEIAYVLDISNTDPIRFDLLFERFLSPGRGSLYQINYVSGETEEIAVSAKKEIYKSDGTKQVLYIHELEAGDVVNFNNGKEVIQDVFVVRPGAAPDVDTDFHTEGREEVIQYCVDKYGEDNVANIVTFGTFKARRAFKSMATVYNIPYAQANLISALIPSDPGNEASLNELLDPMSERYAEGDDFRRAIVGDRLTEVVDMALTLDGRISETGVHPCGVIISKRPLAGIIPTMVRQKDNKLVTQWEYPELEALGLIKMDFLGLELLNTVQQTIENVQLVNAKITDESKKLEVPNMRDLVNGGLDDEATYKTLQTGNTVGIFQLGSTGVRELLRMAKPENFIEIAIITALYRPGPMKSGSPTQYAARKAGTEDVMYIHEDFHGTEVEDVLKETQGLLIFQEQIMLIAGRYAGMTPYETDQLRSAIGKKKMSVMMKMKPKFVEGCQRRGASDKAIKILWETIEVFGQYGFNKSHAVSYALNIYETVYLKTHYPNEFMAALIQQGFGTPEKVRAGVQEATRMGLKVGPIDINNSQYKMSSTTGVESNFNIVYGFSGVKHVNDEVSEAIVKERVANGDYKSVADFVKRIANHVKIKSSALSYLALAGAFDNFGVSRLLTSQKSKLLITSSARKVNKGMSLFDIIGEASAENDVTESVELTGEEFGYNDLIKKEADSLGMFVSGHPIDRLGHIKRVYKARTISQITEENSSNREYTVLGTITQMTSKTNRAGRKSIEILVDDNDTTLEGYLPTNIIKSIEKGVEIERQRKARENKKPVKPSDKMIEIMNDDSIEPIESFELNDVYKFTIKTRGWNESHKMKITDVERIYTAPDGSIPYEMNVPSDTMIDSITQIANRHKVREGTFIKLNYADGTSELMDQKVKLSIEFIMAMESIVGRENIVTEDI